MEYEEMSKDQNEKRDAVVDAARAWDRTRSREEIIALHEALAALDETPEARVVRLARLWAYEYDGTLQGCHVWIHDLHAAVRALPPAPNPQETK